MSTALTLRISQIPTSVSESKFIGLLEDVVGIYPPTKGKVAGKNIILSSFAPCSASTDREKECVATVTFQEVPKIFHRRGRVNLGQGAQSFEVLVESDFFGLTPLNNPGINIDSDIIAVTGLAGHAFGSWKARGAPEMWLRDFLPQAIGKARILTYGYDSKLLKSSSTSSIYDFAKRLLGVLKTARVGDNERRRPIIFISHSLGGLVVKQALVIAARGSERDKEILRSCYALFLFGVPNKGLDIEALRSMVEGQPNSQLIKDLSRGSEALRQLHQGFCDYFNFEDSPIVPIYETKQTKTVVFVDNRWKKEGPEVLMVTEDSATYAGPTTRRYDHFPIDADHSEIAKFEDRSSPEYMVIRDKLIDFCYKAPGVIKRRFEGAGEGIPDDDIAELRKNLQEVLRIVNIEAHATYLSSERCKGTGDWLLTDPDFINWVHGTKSPQTLWLRGPPGIGKTFLMSTVLDFIKVKHWDATVAYFFCDDKSGNPDRRAYPFIVKSLIFQLLSQILAYHPEDVGICLRQLEGDSEQEKMLPVLFRSILSRISKHFGKVFFVIDALDECDNPDGILELLGSLETTTFRIILASRESTGRHLVSYHNTNIRTINISPTHFKHDVEIFIRSKVTFLDVRDLGGPSEAAEMIIRGSDSLFLLARYRLESLKDATISTSADLKRALRDLPKSLTEFYQRALGNRSGQDHALLRRICMWIIYSKRQLQFRELAEAVSISSRNTLLLRGLDKVCGNLVILRPQSGTDPLDCLVEFSHKTVKDFVIDLDWEAPSPTPRLSDTSCKSEIAQEVIVYMNGLETQQPGSYRYTEYKASNKYLLNYVHRFWILHLVDTNNPSDSLIKLLIRFLGSESCYIWWNSAVRTAVNEPTEDWRYLQAQFKGWIAKHAPNNPGLQKHENFMTIQQERQVSDLTRERGHDDIRTLKSTDNLAKMYLELGRWKDAGEVEEKLLKTCKVALGDDDCFSRKVASDLAMSYKRQGRWREVLELQKYLADYCNKLLGEEHPDSLVAARNLARTYKFIGRLKEAEELQKYVMDTSLRVFGKRCSDSLIAMSDLAKTYKSRKRWEEAEALQVEVMNISNDTLGNDHLDSLSAVNNLAAIYAFAGKLETAEKYQKTVVQTLGEVLPENHDRTLSAMTDLAFIYLLQKRSKATEELIEQVLTARIQSMGQAHPVVFMIRTILIFSVAMQGRLLKAACLNFMNNLQMLPLLPNIAPLEILKEVVSGTRRGELRIGSLKIPMVDFSLVKFAEVEGLTVLGEVLGECIVPLLREWGSKLGISYIRDI